ncbi:MAG: hypothetical protein ACP5NP_04650 [Acetobacteraceae bacterium]
MRNPFRWLAVGLAVLSLTACANLLAEREARLQRLVGQKLSVLIAVEGVPDRSFDHAGVTYLAYDRRQVEFVPPPPIFGPAWGFPGPLGWYNAPPPAAVLRECETVFAVKGGIVRGFTLRGNACG